MGARGRQMMSAIVAAPTHAPFNELLRISESLWDRASAETGRFHFPWRQEYANSSGTYHGGALMAMADAAMSRALQVRLEHGQRAATVQMSASFIAADAADAIVSVHIPKAGRRIAHCNASISTTAGKLLFTATATFSVVADA